MRTVPAVRSAASRTHVSPDASTLLQARNPQCKKSGATQRVAPDRPLG